MKIGELYKVKSNPFLRRYGVHVYGALSKHDCKAFAGEVGEIIDTTRFADMPTVAIKFSRGRQTSSRSIDDLKGDFAADFVKVPRSKIPVTE